MTLANFKIIFVIFLSLLILEGQNSLTAQECKLVTSGKTSYAIILGKDASPSEIHGAREFQMFIEMISRAYLPILRENELYSGPMVFIGNSRRLQETCGKLDIESLGNEEFIIKTSGQNLILAGGRLRGSMCAVYTFLEDILGCRWYTSRVSNIPKMDSIILKQLNIHEKPAFEYREPFWKDAFDANWAARNRCNSTFANLDVQRGGRVNYRGIHTFNKLIPGDRYLENHPEYFSITERKRQWNNVHTQLCLSNQETRKVTAQNVLDWIKSDPEGTIFDVSQNDGTGNCQCHHCLTIDSLEGSPSGALLQFVNPIADLVKARYPQKTIATFAYDYTIKPPKITKPRDNIIIRLCTSNPCYSHPVESCEKNKGFREAIEGWSPIANKIYIWDYVTDFHQYLYPHPDITYHIKNIKYFAKMGVDGMFPEGCYSTLGGADGELKAYLEAKLLWNPDLDADVIINDFMEGFYGKAAPAMRKYIELLENKIKNDNIHVWVADPWNVSEYMTPEIITQAEAILNEAKRLAEEDSPEIAYRVEEARLPLRYVKLTLPRQHLIQGNLFVSSPQYDVQNGLLEANNFYATVRKHNIEEFREGGGLESMYQYVLTNIGTHQFNSVDNGKLKLEFLPGIGGMLYKLIDKSSGRNILYEAGITDSWYPAAGGFSAGGWEPYTYTAKETPEGYEITVTGYRPLGRDHNSIITYRSIKTKNNSPELEITTTSRMLQSIDSFRKLTTSPMFFLGDVHDLHIGFSNDGKSFRLKHTPDRTEGTQLIWEMRSPEIKNNYWGVFNPKENIGIFNIFSIADIDLCQCILDTKNNSIQFSLRSMQSMRNQDDSVRIDQKIKILHNFDTIITTQ